MKELMRLVLLGSMTFGLTCGVNANDAEQCLECHIPEEDWVGMSVAEITAAAKDASIKRHKDNAELSDEQLQALLADILPK